MKNKKNIILSLLFILTFIFTMVSCKVFVTSPQAEFSNVNYDKETKSVTFDLSITDSEKIGSNYILNLKNQSDTTESVQSINIETLSTTSYSFSNLTSGSTYILYVTCDYASYKEQEISSKYSFTASESGIETTLGITFESKEITYDGDKHYLYFTYNGSEIKSSGTITLSNTTYYISYDNSNTYATNPGTYTYKLNVYSVSGTFMNKEYTLLTTLTKTLTIKKSSTLYTFENQTVEYSGNDYEYPYTYTGLTYTAYNEAGEKVTPKNPGTYQIKYEFSGDDYYEALNGSYTLTIEKATIECYVKSQTIKIGETNELSVCDSDFSIGGVSYAIEYYDESGQKVEKIDKVGKYTALIKVNENEFYKGFETRVTLNVVEEINNPLIVSHVVSFSIENSNYMGGGKTVYYYNYIELYNNTNDTIDLANVTVSINGQNFNVSGTIEAGKTYVALVYSNSSSIRIGTGFASSTYNFAQYANTTIKNSNIGKISNVSVEYLSSVSSYDFSTNYDDYVATIDNSSSDFLNKKFVYNYTSPSTISEVAQVLKSLSYTAESPTVTFNDLTSISISRIQELYNVDARDALGNTITVTKDMVDTIEMQSENIGKYITITYNIKDSYGNKVTLTRKLLFVDEEGPEVSINESLSRNIEIGAKVNLIDYFIAYDEVDGNITITSDMIETNLDTNVSGVYYATVNVSDSSSNKTSITLILRVGMTYNYLSSITSETVRTDLTGEATALPSTGKVKGLVIPVSLSSSTSVSNTPISTITSAFNGNSASVAFESVSSYYSKASYNKLSLTFDVYSSWIKVPQSKSYYDSNIDELIKYVLNVVSSTYNLADYDSDKDGYIDGVWFVYDINYDSKTNYFWAWTSDFSSYKLTYNNVTLGKIMFASYEFLDSSDTYYSSYDDSKASSITARTFIHETGHLFGLEDYYDYDYDSTVGYSHEMYGITMMDQNYGDLDAASKILLGWINPIIVSSDDVVTIGSTALDSNNAIIISKTIESKGTIFSEYIILEFWTAEGLNSFDSAHTFGNSAYGIRVLHLDATINYQNGVPTLTNGKRPSYFKYNNTDDDSKNFLETLAINKDAIYNSSTKTYTVKNNVLFIDTNTVFGKDVWSNFKYNTGDSLDFTFQISSISNSSVTVTIDFN